MGRTREIAEILGVSLEVAADVRDFIDENYGIDWSEATQREINEAVQSAYSEMVGV